jgi:phosphoglycolate phosphatase-like HAD superfamily hydrolase
LETFVRVLALDFDGVICDSAVECFAIATRTYLDLRPDSPVVEVLGQLGGSTKELAERIGGSSAYRDFLELLPLGNRAEDFGVALALRERGCEVLDQAAYDRERDQQDGDFLREFHRRFYENRHALLESDPDGWTALMSPYGKFVEILKSRVGEQQYAIATSKDRRSVERLLAAYDLAPLFPEGRVLDKEAGANKAFHLKELMRRTGCRPEEATFVDDKVNHLDKVAPLGVRCALAAWGYNAERERELAFERGYRVCSLDDVERQLFDE